MPDRRDIAAFAKRALVLGFVAAASTALFQFWHASLWGLPITKVISYALFFLLIGLLARRSTGALQRQAGGELPLLATALIGVLAFHLREHRASLLAPPRVDIGTDTILAARDFLSFRLNPYLDTRIGAIGQIHQQWGFHYGPAMLLGYLPAGIWGDVAYKLMTLIYLALTAWLCGELAVDKARPRAERAACRLFAALLLLLPSTLWSELFISGVCDLFPVFLMLLSICLVERKRLLLAGVAAGLSFSAKFIPAIALLALFIRWRPHWRAWCGVAIGFIPLLLAGVFWGRHFWLAAVAFHASKPYDFSSLLWYIPVRYHVLFTGLQVASAGILILLNLRRPLESGRLVLHAAILIAVLSVTFKEVHGNHSLWCFPLLVILLAKYSYRFAPAQPAT